MPHQVFIGCGPEHQLPAAVLKHTIELHATEPITVHLLSDVEKEVPIPADWKKKVPTSFSLQRFLIPEACGYEGVGVYLDSDMLCFGDIAELFKIPFDTGETIHTSGGWQSAVMAISCEKVDWQIDRICQRLDDRKIKYGALSNLRYDRSGVTSKLGLWWNWHDRTKQYRSWEREVKARNATPWHHLPGPLKLLHYTTMNGMQPWISRKHALCGLWENTLESAVALGDITKMDIMAELYNGHCRPSLASLVHEKPPFIEKFWYKEQKDAGRKEF